METEKNQNIPEEDIRRLQELQEGAVSRLQIMKESLSDYEAWKAAYIGHLHVLHVNHEDFNPQEDGLSSTGEVIKGGASDVQRYFLAQDHELRQVARRARMSQNIVKKE